MREALLVKKAKQGNKEAFAELYGQIYKKLYQFALYTLRNTQDAEDVVSDTIIDAFSTIYLLRKEEAFSNWMFQILSNKCRKKMRDYYKEEEPIENHRDLENTSCAFCIEEQMDVRKCFFELTGQERMILSMHLFLGYKTKEIASELGINENTVRSKESRALKKMRCKLGKEGAEYEERKKSKTQNKQ